MRKRHLWQCIVKCVGNVLKKIWESQNTCRKSKDIIFFWYILENPKLKLKIRFPLLQLLRRILKALSTSHFLQTFGFKNQSPGYSCSDFGLQTGHFLQPIPEGRSIGRVLSLPQNFPEANLWKFGNKKQDKTKGIFSISAEFRTM